MFGKMRWLFWLGLALLLAACQPYTFKGTEYPEGIQAEEFTLTTEGRPFRFSEQRGKVVLM
ncbi:MAG: hypothetical protein WAS33_25170, partial [Candidatus Promineifilaceae bacterium]